MSEKEFFSVNWPHSAIPGCYDVPALAAVIPGSYDVPGVIRKPDTKPSNPKDAAATTRLDLSLFPATARAYGALAMTEGDYKYGAYNYRAAGVNASVYYSAAGRHLDKWYNGEECDPKTGVPHLASALASIAVLIDGIEKGNWTDDRPPQSDVAGLLDRLQERVAHLQKVFPRQTPRFTAVPIGERSVPAAYRDELTPAGAR